MVQIYLVSVLSNMLAGMMLAGPYLSKRAPALEVVANLPTSRPRFTWITGIVTSLAGLLKFGTVLSGDVPVAGDLLPALIGVWMGASLVYRGLAGPGSSPAAAVGETGSGDAVDPSTEADGYSEFDPTRREPGGIPARLFGFRPELVGMAGMIIAFTHFLFPRVVLI
jgi:hypothetical protein